MLRYVLSWPVHMTFIWMLGQRNVSIYSVRLFWKHVRLPKQHPDWYNSAKRQWMTFPPSILWGHLGCPHIRGTQEMKLPMSSQGRELFASLLDRNQSWEVSWQKKKQRPNARTTTSIWQCGGVSPVLRQAWKLISGPSPTAKTRLLSFNRIQSWVVTVLLTGHNILKRHLYIMGLIDSPYAGGVKQGNKPQLMFWGEALASHRHTYLGSYYLDPEDVRSASLGTIWNFSKGTGLPRFGHQTTRHKGAIK
jgi:hypothetical protein